jgi:eukaryotic-like serine/threonine-protein kinase
MSTSDAPRTIGGRYRLDRPIGRGGMGTVWLGHDELLGREVAVKEVRFPPELGTQEIADLRERTLREARATARLSHPNVITTYDVVEEDGRPWIVMELLRTHSLSEILRDEGALPAYRVAEVGLGVLAALETAHAQGVVHRDVKPGNVLVTEDGRPVLTDFGIATTAGDPALTSTGVVLGSPAYMSPERARGKAFGPESDLWSLGVTLYAAAEGRPPFESDNALGTLTAVISDPVPPMTVGGPLAVAVDGLLRKDPQERSSIDTVRTQLQQAAADRTTAASAPVAETVALERAGRTEALPAAGVGAAAPAAAAPEPPAPASTPYAGEGGRRSRLLVPALVVGLLLIGAIVAFALLPDRGSGQPSADQPTTKSTSVTQSSSSPPPSTSAPPSDNGVPAGYQLYEDPTGFSVAVPDGWQAEQSTATAVDITAPDGTRFLRVDQTDQPKDDPKKDWERQEKSVKKELPNYQRIGIESVDYNGWPAADWEFTFGDSVTTHVLDRGFVTDDSRGYALYLSTPEDQWAGSQDVFQTAAETFQPAG